MPGQIDVPLKLNNLSILYINDATVESCDLKNVI